MKPLILPVLCAGALCLAVASNARAAKVAGVEIEESLNVAGQSLKLQGAGLRTRLFIKLYAAGLYIPEGSPSQATWLVDSDEPIAITLDIVSDLVTRDRMIEALNEGFAASTGGNTDAVANEMQQLKDAMGGAMKAGSSMTFAYEPGVGTRVSRDGEETTIIEGLDFKRALFGIWLSDKPVTPKLKAALLGN